MKKWIKFNLDHPRSMLSLLLLITLLAIWGITRIQFDSSVEVLMPKSDPVYKLGQRVKRVFGDSKTFTIAAIEPVKGEKLFSKKIFTILDDMVTELEEYKDFDKEKEDRRLGILLKLGNIKKKKSQNKEQLRPEKINSVSTNIEDELDKEILEGDTSKKDTESKNNNDDIFDLEKPVSAAESKKPIRNRYQYDYTGYQPITLAILRKNLDRVANLELDTILRYHKLAHSPGKENKETNDLTPVAYRKILESWEDLYLFKSQGIIKTLMDPISAEDIQGSKTELKPVDLIPKNNKGRRILPETEQDFEIYKKKLSKNPLFASAIYSQNQEGEIKAFGINYVLRYQSNHKLIRNYLWSLINKYDKDPIKIYLNGSMIFNKFMNESSQRDMSIFVPLVILIVIITFALNFRSGRGVFLPTLTVIMACIWTMGLMGLLGIKLSIIGTIIPTLLIAIASSYSIHIFNQYLLDVRDIHKKDKKTGLADSLNHISTTVALAGVTTFIGFSTLTISQVTSLRYFGIFAAIGTLFSVIIAVILISSSLMLMKLLPMKAEKDSSKSKTINPESAHGNILVRKIVRFFSYYSLNHAKKVLILALVTVSLGILGTTQVTTETTPTTYFKEGSYMRKSTKKIGDLFNGAFVFNVVIDSGKEDGVKDPEFLNFVQNTQDWLNRREQIEGFNILHNTSFTDMIKRMHKAMNEDNHNFYAIPKSKTTITDYLEIFSGKDDDSDGRPDAFESTIDKNWRRVNLFVRMGEKYGKLVGTEMTRRARDHILKFLDSSPNPNGYTWFIVGNPVNFIILSEYILKGQIQTIILSILIVGFIIFLLFRNVYAGLVALIPISVSILLVFGVMGALGIPLDIAQAILSSVAIGIGVDDTIHFLNTLRKKINEGKSLHDAIQATHNEAGLAIIYTSIALIFGFFVLMLSSFNPVFYFGFLVSSVMAATTIGALLFLPAVIYVFNLPLEKEVDWKIVKWLNIRKIFE